MTRLTPRLALLASLLLLAACDGRPGQCGLLSPGYPLCGI